MTIIGRAVPFLFAGVEAKFRYLRMVITKINAGTYTNIGDVYWVAGGSDYPNPRMTSNSAPSPLVASASSYLSSGATYFPYFAFDASAVGWQSNSNTFPSQVGSQWLSLDLGAGNAIAVSGIGIKPPASVAVGMPVDFACYGSNAGTFSGEEALLFSATGVTTGWTANTRRNFTF